MKFKAQQTKPTTEFEPIEHMYSALEFCDAAPRYTEWQVRLIRPHLGQHILEVGAGTGALTQHIVGTCQSYTALEIDPPFAQYLEKQHGHKPGFTCLQGDITTEATVSTLAERNYDTLFSSNVIEHIEDHEKAIRNQWRLLDQGGRLVILVPAMQSLYSEWDQAIGHYRRYYRSELTRLCESLGFQTIQCKYVNLIGAVGWFYNFTVMKRKLSEQQDNQKMVLYSKIYNRFFMPMIEWVESKADMPFGLSVLYVGKKI